MRLEAKYFQIEDGISPYVSILDVPEMSLGNFRVPWARLACKTASVLREQDKSREYSIFGKEGYLINR